MFATCARSGKSLALPRFIFALLLAVEAAGSDYAAEAERLAAHEKVRAAMAYLEQNDEKLIAETVELTEIAAPPFKEAERARAVAERFRQLGLKTWIDEEGNVIAERRGSGGPRLVLSAHLDTVFPEELEIKVKREGNRIYAPGIADDTRGVALLLHTARALERADVATRGDIIFVGTVGEEGLGNLRGVRYLLEKGPLKGNIDYFISIDGTDATRVVNRGVGSKRYLVTYKGPGGHSYGAFGLVSPAFALGRAVAKLSALEVPTSPKTTYNVGRIGGGTSVNSIPYEAWMEVDMRSESPEELGRVEAKFKRFLQEALEEENALRRAKGARLELELKLIGDRPAGGIAEQSEIVQKAIAATRFFGLEPRLAAGSTDSNIPFKLGLQAVTLGSGGKSDGHHSPGEWFENNNEGVLAAKRNLLLALLLVGLAD